jgi:hypothetical protein
MGEQGNRDVTRPNQPGDCARHHPDCDWHLDQDPADCTCGLSRPKQPWLGKQPPTTTTETIE